MLALTTYSKSHFARPKFAQAFCSQIDASLKLQLKGIEKLRLSDPKEELTRLKSNPSIRTRLENVLSAYEPEKIHGLFPSLLHQISYCRSIEVLKAVGDTHIVLNHGQEGSYLLSLNILNCELQNLCESNQSLEFEVKLRHPISFVDQPICDQTHSVDWFKKIRF